MRNIFEMVTGDNNKNEGKITVSLKCKGLKLDYHYDGPKRYDTTANVNEKCQFEVEDFEIAGECEATMSGFFKLIASIKDAIMETSSNSNEGSKPKTIDTDAIARRMFNGADAYLNMGAHKIQYAVLTKEDARSIVYDKDMQSRIDSAKMIVAFSALEEKGYDAETIVTSFLYMSNHSNILKDSNNDIHFETLMKRIQDIEGCSSWKSIQENDGNTTHTIILFQ